MTATDARRLTAPEAEALWRAWTTRTTHARDRLVLAYAPMVKYLASQKVRELPTHCELDDLVSCGLVAVVEAVDRFDPAKGATFEQYAWTRVAGAIVDELRRQDRVSRSCPCRSPARSSGRRTPGSPAPGAPASEDELAGELRISVQRAPRHPGRARSRPRRLAEHPVGPEPRAADRDRRDDRRRPRPARPRARAARQRAAPATFRAAMARLSDRERDVLTLVYVAARPGRRDRPPARRHRVARLADPRLGPPQAAHRARVRARTIASATSHLQEGRGGRAALSLTNRSSIRPTAAVSPRLLVRRRGR